MAKMATTCRHRRNNQQQTNNNNQENENGEDGDYLPTLKGKQTSNSQKNENGGDDDDPPTPGENRQTARKMSIAKMTTTFRR